MISYFNRTTGSPIRLAFDDCECKSYGGRSHCFSCVIAPDYEEQEPRLSGETTKPNWNKKWVKVMFTPADLRFLAGIPERKPFYNRRRKQWKKTW